MDPLLLVAQEVAVVQGTLTAASRRTLAARSTSRSAQVARVRLVAGAVRPRLARLETMGDLLISGRSSSPMVVIVGLRGHLRGQARLAAEGAEQQVAAPISPVVLPEAELAHQTSRRSG